MSHMGPLLCRNFCLIRYVTRMISNVHGKALGIITQDITDHQARPEADEKDACLPSLVIRAWVTVTPGRRNSRCRGTEAMDGSGVRLERGAFEKPSIISSPQFPHLQNRSSSVYLFMKLSKVRSHV